MNSSTVKKAIDNPDRLYSCTNCKESFTDIDLFRPHLERHREDLAPKYGRKGKPLSIACPGGCGRHLPTKSDGAIVRDWKDHPEACDGQPPLQTSANPEPPAVPAAEKKPIPTQEERDMADFKCSKGCGKRFTKDGKRRATHEADCDGTAKKGAGKARGARPALAAAGSSDVAPAVQLLRDRAAALREEAVTLTKRADALDEKADQVAEV